LSIRSRPRSINGAASGRPAGLPEIGAKPKRFLPQAFDHVAGKFSAIARPISAVAVGGLEI
jgi:hypothetical protein